MFTYLIVLRLETDLNAQEAEVLASELVEDARAHLLDGESLLLQSVDRAA